MEGLKPAKQLRAKEAKVNCGGVDHLPWDEDDKEGVGWNGVEYSVVGGPDTLVWCLHCERVYRWGDAIWNEGLWMCAYFPDCDGDAVMDASVIEGCLQVDGRGFVPQNYEVGKCYPMYPSERGD